MWRTGMVWDDLDQPPTTGRRKPSKDVGPPPKLYEAELREDEFDVDRDDEKRGFWPERMPVSCDLSFLLTGLVVTRLPYS
jgi:hypothetical protein